MCHLICFQKQCYQFGTASGIPSTILINTRTHSTKYKVKFAMANKVAVLLLQSYLNVMKKIITYES